ncbi:class I SAM-dependent methyltransferase [Cryobacterium algoritolerans]|uniref:Class I SAM-dependent methyltransferase n=1 Tax=Cryobacterium algoritolerans TaxID=1259184 RepID=A0A4R8WTU1_9MICO|nr:class I SAM-dependent methyltransferase [Cryobacterium algoritolerans]TFC14588.1 class I SAM-dependent methyltransferase [Cryobacterium algoritolerans]
MTVSNVSDAYGRRSAAYVELFGRIDAAAEADREAVLAWARGLTGPVIDVGCGPGQWTHFLFEHGLEIEGIDPTPEFIDAAEQQYPEVRFRIGQAEHLDVDNGSLGGVLSWYSLIHIDPLCIDTALAEFARCLRPGGSLALGFFEGPEVRAFSHAVATAYYWPLDTLSARVEACGFTITEAGKRTDPGVRAHGFITSTRNSS